MANNRAVTIIEEIMLQEKLSEQERDSLAELKEILSGEKQEYYTDEMYNALSAHINFESISDEDFDAIIAAFYETPNLKKP